MIMQGQPSQIINPPRKQQGGFSLIELALVLILAGAVTAFAIKTGAATRVINKIESDASLAKNEVEQVFEAAGGYLVDREEWPDDAGGCADAITALVTPSATPLHPLAVAYLRNISNLSPYGTPYQTSCDRTTFTININTLDVDLALVLKNKLAAATVVGSVVTATIPRPEEHPTLTQFLLIDGTRAMTGNLDMAANDINNVGDIGARNINANDINANDINARNISMGGVLNMNDNDIIDAQDIGARNISMTGVLDMTNNDINNVRNINANDINANDINANDINADDINANDINARNINMSGDLDMSNNDINRVGDIGARDIGARDIEARSIEARDIRMVGGDIDMNNNNINNARNIDAGDIRLDGQDIKLGIGKFVLMGSDAFNRLTAIVRKPNCFQGTIRGTPKIILKIHGFTAIPDGFTGLISWSAQFETISIAGTSLWRLKTTGLIAITGVAQTFCDYGSWNR